MLALLREGLGNSEIARRLKADRAAVRRIREEHNIPAPPQQPLSLEEKWAANVKQLEGGHLEWTGPRGTSSGTPILRYRDDAYSPAALAFSMRTGREPAGQVYADCGVKHCVAPAHVLDEPERTRVREQLRRTLGMPDREPFCGRGHDQETEGRFQPDGVAYCNACVTENKRKSRVNNGEEATP
ncbi:hypothetical protein H8R17_35760 [Streptomyces sp. TRM68367]|nr:hypothetical protein [Streptomyces sp. TRM68367]